MRNAKFVWLFGGLLTLFWLFAVYSTSIYKSFNQGSKVTIVQNIETISAFDTLLSETIEKKTLEIINTTGDTQLITPPTIGTGETTWETQIAITAPILEAPEELKKLENPDSTKLVDNQSKVVKNRSNYKYFFNQLRSLIISLIFALIIYLIPINILQDKRLIWTLLGAVVLFQLMVFVPAFEARYGTSRGWVDIPGLPNMQPSEFFKIGYLFFMAFWITKRKEIINSYEFLSQFAAINGIVFLVLLMIPDFGTIFILALTATIMSRFHGLSLKKIWILASIAMGVLIVWSLVIWLFNSKYNYALARINTFMTTDEVKKQEQEKGAWWQLKQGIMAVGWGGFLGQGYGKGLQKMWYLPEAHSDMIFDAFSEEIGFVGNMALLALYFGLFYSVLIGINSVKNEYLKLVAIGLISLLIIQVFVHIWVNLWILPNTGLTLPFVSHGGTALMINLLQLTLIYKILVNK